MALQEAGRAEEAITLYQRAAEAGDASSLESAVEALREAGRVEEAISRRRSRAEGGDTYALQMAAQPAAGGGPGGGGHFLATVAR